MATAQVPGVQSRPLGGVRSGALGGARSGALRGARSGALRGAGPRAFTSGPVARIRWHRVGRVAMLCLLVALVYLYVSAGIRIYSTYREAHADRASLAALEREHVALVHQHEALGRHSTVEEEARRLQMMRPGEQPYVIENLPGD